jgi:hypothetical protein
MGLLIGGSVWGVVLLYALVVFAFGSTLAWTSPTRVCTQPESIVYEQGFSFSVFVREPSLSLSLSTPPPTAIVSRIPDGSYGVHIELNSSRDAHAVTCRWEPDRVAIIEPSGIEHTIPARVLTGGR